MKFVCQGGNGNKLDDNFEEVVSFPALISKINLEGSRRLANDVLRFLQKMYPSNDDYCLHLSSLRLSNGVIDRALKEGLSGSNMVHYQFFQAERSLKRRVIYCS